MHEKMVKCLEMNPSRSVTTFINSSGYEGHILELENENKRLREQLTEKEQEAVNSMDMSRAKMKELSNEVEKIALERKDWQWRLDSCKKEGES